MIQRAILTFLPVILIFDIYILHFNNYNTYIVN